MTSGKIFLIYIFLASGGLSSIPPSERARKPKCSNPDGNVGDSFVQGCSRLECVKTKRKANWVENFASDDCCSYQRTGFLTGQVITTTVAQDNCSTVTLLCVTGQNGAPHIEMKVESECTKAASEEKLDMHSNQTEEMLKVMMNTLNKILNNTEHPSMACPAPPPPTTTTMKPPASNPKLLYLGPGFSSSHHRYSEVLTLPDMSPSNCSVPQHPNSIHGYVATITTKGTLLCGGYENGIFLAACYILSGGAWIFSPPMLSSRVGAAAVSLDSGWWVTGVGTKAQTLATTEIYDQTSRQWKMGVNLPTAITGHCLVKVNSSHVFMTGGWNSSRISATTYIWSQENGFVKMPDMPTERTEPACAILGQTIWVAGGLGPVSSNPQKVVEKFSLVSLSWRAGPNLPQNTNGDMMVVGEDKLVFVDGFRRIIYQHENGTWDEIAKLSRSRKWSQALEWNYDDCD